MSFNSPNKFGNNAWKTLSTLRNLPPLYEQTLKQSHIKFAICPFKIKGGATFSTETGYKGLNEEPNDFTSLELLLTGPIITQWQNSQKTIPINPDPDDITKDYAEVRFQTGTIFKGFIEQAEIQQAINPSAENSLFSVQRQVKQIKVIFLFPAEGEVQNDNMLLFQNLSTYLFNFFQIPELFASFKNDKTTQYKNLFTDEVKEWYSVLNWNFYYPTNSKVPYGIEVIFHSVNDRVSTTGLNINAKIMLANGNAESCAIPYVNDGVVELDKNYLIPRPITHLQLFFNGNIALNSIEIIGRPIELIKENDKIVGYKILPLRNIYPYSWESPVNDLQNLHKAPSCAYYSLINCVPTLESYVKEWSDFVKVNYNPAAGQTAIFEGMLECDGPLTTATNDATLYSGYHLNYWDPDFLIDKGWNTTPIDTITSRYFYINPQKYFKEHTFPTTLGLKSFIPNNMVVKNLSNWIAINSKIWNQCVELPETIKQRLPLGFFGSLIYSIFNAIFSLGQKPSYGVLSNKYIPNTMPVAMLVSVSAYDASQALFAAKPITGKGLIPFDTLKNDGNDVCAGIYGTIANTNAFAFNLTDNIELKPTNISDGTYLNNPTERIKSSFETQLNSTKDKVYLANETFNILPPDTTDPKDYKVGFIIDRVNFLSSFKGDYKIYLFSKPYNFEAPVSFEECIYAANFQSYSVNSKSMRTWLNIMQLGSEFVVPENQDKIRFPQNVQSPDNPESLIYRQHLNIQQVEGIGAQWRFETSQDPKQPTWYMVDSVVGENGILIKNLEITFPLPPAEFINVKDIYLEGALSILQSDVKKMVFTPTNPFAPSGGTGDMSNSKFEKSFKFILTPNSPTFGSGTYNIPNQVAFTSTSDLDIGGSKLNVSCDGGEFQGNYYLTKEATQYKLRLTFQINSYNNDKQVEGGYRFSVQEPRVKFENFKYTVTNAWIEFSK